MRVKKEEEFEKFVAAWKEQKTFSFEVFARTTEGPPKGDVEHKNNVCKISPSSSSLLFFLSFLSLLHCQMRSFLSCIQEYDEEMRTNSVTAQIDGIAICWDPTFVSFIILKGLKVHVSPYSNSILSSKPYVWMKRSTDFINIDGSHEATMRDN